MGTKVNRMAVRMFSAGEIIDFAVQIEQNGENLCRAAAQKKIDPVLASLLEWMADQETQHVRWLSKLKQRIRIAPKADQLEQLGKALLGDVLGDQGFSLQDADFSDIKHIKQLLSVLIEFEQDTVLFYKMLHTAIDDQEAGWLLDKIIAEENQHIIQIKDYFQKRFGCMQ